MFLFRLVPLILLLAAAPLAARDANADAVRALQSGNLKRAETTLRTHLSAEPNDAISLQLLAIVLDKEKKYTAADSFYRQALAIAPHSPGLLNNYGNHLLAMEKVGAARKAFRQVLVLDPSHANANEQLARIALMEKQPRDALTYLQQLLRNHKNAMQRKDVAALLARTTSALGYFADAVQAWDAYLKQEPDDAVARRERAFAEAAIGKDPQMALAELKQFARMHPRDPIGHYELGTAESTADPGAALAELNQALVLAPNLATAHFARGLLRYRAGDLQAAVADFTFDVKAEPGNAAALDRLAEVYVALNRTYDALPLLRKAASLAPQDGRVQLHLGQALTKLGEHSEAMQAFRRYRELKSGEQSLPNAAGLLEFLGLSPAEQYAQYRAGVERAVKKDPQNADAQVRYLGIVLNERDFVSARQVCERLALLHPAPEELQQALKELRAAGQDALAQSLLDKSSRH